MNVLFISDVPMRNPSSGSEQVLYNQALGLSKIGDKITVINRINGKGPIQYFNEDLLSEGTYFADPTNITHFVSSTYRLPSKIYKKFYSVDTFGVIICHQPFTFFALLVKNNIRKLPILYIFHSPSHEEYLLANKNVPKWKNLFQAHLRKRIEGFCIKRAQKVITLSRYMADKVKAIHRIPSERIFINAGGVDLNRFHHKKNRSRLKDELNLPSGRIHLLTIRNLDYRMGLDNLLQAITILKDKQLEFHLTIGGEGPERKCLETMVKTFSLGHVVTLTGFIPKKDLANYYAAADFFILPTRCLEGFGLVTPESMACGTPVLGTPVGGTKEILSGFNSELLFKGTSPEAMADGIQHAINEYYYDKRKYASLRQQCRKYIEERYSWDRHVEQLRGIIADVVSNEGLASDD